MTDELKQIVFLLKEVNKKLANQNEYWKHWKKLEDDYEIEKREREQERKERKEKTNKLVMKFLQAGTNAIAFDLQDMMMHSGMFKPPGSTQSPKKGKKSGCC